MNNTIEYNKMKFSLKCKSFKAFEQHNMLWKKQHEHYNHIQQDEVQNNMNDNWNLKWNCMLKN